MTTDCDPGTIEREPPQLVGWGGIENPDTDGAILVEYKDDPKDYPLSDREDYDVHTALTHGLATYLATLSGSYDGRSTGLANISTDWADYEDGSNLPCPSCAVYSTEDGSYEQDGGNSTPQRISSARVDRPDGTIVTVKYCGIYELDALMADVVCEDKIQRAGVRLMLENASNPCEWMTGFRLILPRYHNAVAVFMLASAKFSDTSELARENIRMLSMTFAARVCVYRNFALPLADIQTSGTITTEE